MQDNNYKLLYAEDDNNIRENYAVIFKIFFKEVYTAKDGLEAYEMYNSINPDLLIFDIDMPNINGLDLTEKIRNSNKDIPIILLTADGKQEQLLKAIDLQITKYLIKPVKITKLEETMHYVISLLNAVHKDKIYLECNIYWDLNKRLLFKENNIVKLSYKEFELLKILCSNVNQIFSNEDLINLLWYDRVDSSYDTKPLRALVNRIKTKLNCQIIESIYNVGYKIKQKHNNLKI